MAGTPIDSENPSASLLVRYPSGSVIFRQGQPPGDMYIIEEGQVELHIEESGQARLAVFEAGDFFGEGSILSGEPRHATARALCDCSLLAIDAASLDRLVRESPDASLMMLRKLSRRLCELESSTVPGQAPVQEPATSGGPVSDEVVTVPPLAGEPLPGEPHAPALPTAAELVHPESGARFQLSPGENLIGRFDSSTQTSPEVDLGEVDLQRSLSRRHARISWVRGVLVVREESGVANGTYLAGVRLVPGKEYAIAHGDRLRVGRVELVLEVTSEGSRA
jgi:hypothetical protein